MALYHIAGLPVDMSPQFVLLGERAQPYRVDEGEAVITVPPLGNDAFEEYSETAKVLYRAMLPFDAFFLHSSAIEYNGKAYVFSAPSGTGKSTHTAYWCNELGARIINDDKPVIRLIDGEFYVCGTPFSGKNDLSRNVCVPLGGIAMLYRADHNVCDPLPKHKALFSLLNQTLRPGDMTEYEKLLSLLEQLLDRVPCYRIGCTNSPQAARAAADSMT